MREIGPQDRQKIIASILDKYEDVAESPIGKFEYPTGRRGLEKLGYDAQLTHRLPEEVREFFVGVGNPFSFVRIAPGMKVLDVGCGAGVDTLLAAMLAGSGGVAAGVEFSGPMAARAEKNRRMAGIGNAGFFQGAAENLPFARGSFDVLISNGVYNLVIEKKKALSEAFRVLKQGGRLLIADQVLKDAVRPEGEDAVSSWFT